MSGNFLAGKKTLTVSLFVSFLRDLESKRAFWEPEKNIQLPRIMESNEIGLVLLFVRSI